MILRDYQQECKSSIFKEWEDHNSTLAVLFTAAGKTVIFASVIGDLVSAGKKVIVIAGRRELIKQAKAKIERVTGFKCGVEMGQEVWDSERIDLFDAKEGECKIIIATIQTLIAECDGRSRIHKFKPHEFGAVILDEAHNCVSDSYLNVINYFKQNPNQKILGVTATPDRMDEKALGQICETVAFEADILFGINNGWLVPIRQQQVRVKGLDFSAIRTVGDDLDKGELAQVLEEEENLHGMVHPMLEVIYGLPPKSLTDIPIEQWTSKLEGLKAKRTLIFTHSVRQAELTSQILNRHVSNLSRWIHGGTKEDYRIESLEMFHDGRLSVLANCSVLFEGYDNPEIEVVICAKPTKSRSRYVQIIGRGTRTLEGIVDGIPTPEERKTAIAQSSKPVITIVDFTGNCGRHKLISPLDILGGNYSERAIERAQKMADQLSDPEDTATLLARADGQLKHEDEELSKKVEEARRKNVKAKSEFVTRTINPFDILDIRPAQTRGWHEGKHLTEKQKAVLVRASIYDPGMEFAQQQQLVQEVCKRAQLHLATFKQIKLLKSQGQDARKWTMDQASKAIDQIAANGWKLPKNFKAPTGSANALPTTDLITPAQSGLLQRLGFKGDTSKMGRKQAGAIIGNLQSKAKTSQQEPLPF